MKIPKRLRRLFKPLPPPDEVVYMVADIFAEAPAIPDVKDLSLPIGDVRESIELAVILARSKVHAAEHAFPGSSIPDELKERLNRLEALWVMLDDFRDVSAEDKAILQVEPGEPGYDPLLFVRTFDKYRKMPPVGGSNFER